ncbi:hypothetical protein D5086_021509 [Populus alba]|uniref:Uncharacterized protein n=1 Tax=Populus alba TaxID=43335 RepID=A0ACC4BCW6_POPAL
MVMAYSPHSYGFLLAPVIGVDIKQALFSIGDSKAPCSDGHLAFANDILLLCRGDMPSVSILLQQLVFRETSGFVINVTKSSIYFAGVSGDVKQAILRSSGFTEGSFPFKYLGVPLSSYRLLASQFSPLLHKLELSI